MAIGAPGLSVELLLEGVYFVFGLLASLIGF